MEIGETISVLLKHPTHSRHAGQKYFSLSF